MADPRFFRREGPFTLSRLAELAGLDGVAGELELATLASLETAGRDALGFFSDVKRADELANTKAGAVLIKAEHADLCPEQTLAVICPDPYRAMAQVTQIFYPDAAQSRPMGGVSAAHLVHPDAKIGKNVEIAPNVSIGAGAEIGDGCSLGAGVSIGHGVVLGRDCTVLPNASLAYALIGDRVIIQSGAVLGSDGFGFAPGASHAKVPQVGRVIVQADVEIGANASIDRGAFGDTVIGEGSKLDNLVHLAHNVQLGRHCFITACCAVAGSSVLGDYVQMGGCAAVTGHVTIGDRCVISAQAAVLRSFPADSQIAGSPGRLRSELYREMALVSRLRKTAEREKKS
ncbi:MAG: UDP-3-O-(3-hydroxymyristoyl)glucosamine N-acyltransferase [Rhodobiaceae bacterium]|jgi:UDP-3-O-[3-hydroxymyristoyl] glucosamine N-acyltransferase|nr:UDP-3-O-(3-hydroxymyristoyl)glucosamine N-acyltransferase [Rhodobiaceae bacterium]MBT7280059.1 UDP-3-O-(3-hydroxymyristoyl)glucosamine N-acyltransferase [Rhodobiaceae bacterium]MDG2495076.1 UDP-3-O-(3-hydroxymyristoyl)glucosamine N-acyltransferase [Alphaproteobacteria bacterium]